MNKSSVLERNFTGFKLEIVKQRIGAIIMGIETNKQTKTYNLVWLKKFNKKGRVQAPV